ncbi:MAG TPA: hypothetical protein VIK68_11695 [Sphingomicrobium sp.]
MGPFRTKVLTAAGNSPEPHGLDLGMCRLDSLCERNSLSAISVAELLQDVSRFVERLRKLR